MITTGIFCGDERVQLFSNKVFQSPSRRKHHTKFQYHQPYACVLSEFAETLPVPVPPGALCCSSITILTVINKTFQGCSPWSASSENENLCPSSPVTFCGLKYSEQSINRTRSTSAASGNLGRQSRWNKNTKRLIYRNMPFTKQAETNRRLSVFNYPNE